MTERHVDHKRYYRYDPDANSFAGVAFSMIDDDKITNVHSDDAPILQVWQTLRCEVFDDNPPVDGDFPSVSNYRRVPMISQRAWQAIRSLVGYCCEALPVDHPSGRPYFILHVMETIDCLDTEASEVSRSEIGDKRINRIYRYAFKDSLLNGKKHIFKLPLMCGGELIIDDHFRRAVEKNGLCGLRFRELPMNASA
jgi:hypothetical protein